MIHYTDYASATKPSHLPSQVRLHNGKQELVKNMFAVHTLYCSSIISPKYFFVLAAVNNQD